MRKLLIALILLSSYRARSQDSVAYRFLLIGSAGTIGKTQEIVVSNAFHEAIKGKTAVLFLGNNVQPSGMSLGSKEKARRSEESLELQYDLFRGNDVPVYFVPGVADWDNNGPDGYQKIVRLNEYISQQGDSLLQVIPSGACPGPVEVHVADNVVLVAIDTEWWLYPYDKHVDGLDCDCRTRRDVLSKLDDILERNRSKVVLFATSHPFASYGPHGGYFSLRQHLFPLATNTNKLFIPLPVVGSVYPMFRKVFPPVTDLGNLLYRNMIADVSEILSKHPNVIHVSGNERSLQFINKTIPEMVSGAGSGTTPVKQGDSSLFASSDIGYGIVDVLTNNTVRLSFSTTGDGASTQAFVVDRSYVMPLDTAQQAATNLALGEVVKRQLDGRYDKVSATHRALFGENYRKVWATQTSIPVLRLSNTELNPKELGGGMQTHSLRLTDNQKKEWVFRSIEKYPESVVGEAFNNTFVTELLRDNVTATLPFAPLTVPVFANALGLAHSNPKLVYVAPDKKLGIYSKDFANTLCLVEEREPAGKSVSTINMTNELKKDNDNQVDQQRFLTARFLDIFLGDWDRHGDQWRWVDTRKGKGKHFEPVPRDRDQVYYVNQGFFLKILSLPWIMPKFQGFGPRIKDIRSLSFNARLIDGAFTNELNARQWSATAGSVVQALTDSVIRSALQKMPPEVYAISGQQLAAQLQLRRQDLLRAAPVYYRFLNRVIDITLSDKRELVFINDTLDGQLHIHIIKPGGKVVYDRLLQPSVTQEVRLYLYGGDDSVVVANSHSPIKLRMVGDGVSKKRYSVTGSRQSLIHVYEGTGNATFGDASIRKHLSDKPANFTFEPTNRYNNTIPLLSAGYNLDDGFILGAGVKWLRQGFRSDPYASVQQLTFGHSFSTDAFRFLYSGEFLHALGGADLLVQVKALAPNNTQNFFGRGNETAFDKTGNYKRYYRARFSLLQADPSIRWHLGKSNTLSVGPSAQYYYYDRDDNHGRFINQRANLGSYDSLTVANDKAHAGIVATFKADSRNSIIIPTSGCYLTSSVSTYAGLNKYSKAYGQWLVDAAAYKSLDRRASLVLADRIGGGVTAGNTAFYQSLFLGGHDNLRGFRQYRFAGEQLFYNNLEARLRLANVVSYFLPGELGVLGFYDVGRVWQKGDVAGNIWHQGVGGGVYFAPANIALLQLVTGYSREGWYPYFSLGFRF